MSAGFVPFDAVTRRVREALTDWTVPECIDRIYLLRNLHGRVRITVSDVHQQDEACQDALRTLGRRLHDALGAHGHSSDHAVAFARPELLAAIADTARPVRPRVFWVDRLLTGHGWWTVGNRRPQTARRRVTLYSVKGGVGRSTTAAVAAWHLARRGERVLVIDLDLESPGLSSAMLDPASQPDFGVTDWFIEDLVGQAERVVERMIAAPPWAEDFDGGVHVVPAHGRDPGEYLAKLGRVHMDNSVRWSARLDQMLSRLEEIVEPTIVLLESRSGLHDIAAATVTDIDAEVLLFAVDAESHWTDYGILFRHWRDLDLATRIRQRVSIVSALTPELDTERYLRRFRERSWSLFAEHLYDEVPASSDAAAEFSFDIDDHAGPHDPIAVHWTRGLAAGASLRRLEGSTVRQAYTPFLVRFDVIAGGTDVIVGGTDAATGS